MDVSDTRYHECIKSVLCLYTDMIINVLEYYTNS